MFSTKDICLQLLKAEEPCAAEKLVLEPNLTELPIRESCSNVVSLSEQSCTEELSATTQQVLEFSTTDHTFLEKSTTDETVFEQCATVLESSMTTTPDFEPWITEEIALKPHVLEKSDPELCTIKEFASDGSKKSQFLNYV